jgi:hypothetical protein
MRGGRAKPAGLNGRPEPSCAFKNGDRSVVPVSSRRRSRGHGVSRCVRPWRSRQPGDLRAAHSSFPTVLSLGAGAALGHRLYSGCGGDRRRCSGSQNLAKLRVRRTVGRPRSSRPVDWACQSGAARSLQEPRARGSWVLVDDTPIHIHCRRRFVSCVRQGRPLALANPPAAPGEVPTPLTPMTPPTRHCS